MPSIIEKEAAFDSSDAGGVADEEVDLLEGEEGAETGGEDDVLPIVLAFFFL